MSSRSAEIIPFPRRPVRIPDSMRANAWAEQLRFLQIVRRGNAAYVKDMPQGLSALWVRDEERWAQAARKWQDKPIYTLGTLRVVERAS